MSQAIVERALDQIRADYTANTSKVIALENELAAANLKLASYESVTSKYNTALNEARDYHNKLVETKKKLQCVESQYQSALDKVNNNHELERDLRQAARLQETRIDVLKRELIKLSEDKVRLVDINQSLLANNIKGEQLENERARHAETHREVTQVINEYEAKIADFNDQINELVARSVEQSELALEWKAKYEDLYEIARNSAVDYQAEIANIETELKALKESRDMDKVLVESAILTLHRVTFKNRGQQSVTVEESVDNIDENQD